MVIATRLKNVLELSLLRKLR